MKLKDLSDAIAQTCDVRANVVNAVQAETFRQLRGALDKGEKVVIPDFGVFAVKEIQGENGARKVVRFKERAGEKGEKKDKKGKKEGRKRAVAPEASSEGDDE